MSVAAASTGSTSAQLPRTASHAWPPITWPWWDWRSWTVDATLVITGESTVASLLGRKSQNKTILCFRSACIVCFVCLHSDHSDTHLLTLAHLHLSVNLDLINFIFQCVSCLSLGSSFPPSVLKIAEEMYKVPINVKINNCAWNLFYIINLFNSRRQNNHTWSWNCKCSNFLKRTLKSARPCWIKSWSGKGTVWLFCQHVIVVSNKFYCQTIGLM